jgi:hypothetical protein
MVDRALAVVLDGYGLNQALQRYPARDENLFVTYGCGPAPDFDRLPRCNASVVRANSTRSGVRGVWSIVLADGSGYQRTGTQWCLRRSALSIARLRAVPDQRKAEPGDHLTELLIGLQPGAVGARFFGVLDRSPEAMDHRRPELEEPAAAG